MAICEAVDAYIRRVRSGKYPVCKEQIKICGYVEKCFSEEDIHVDEQQLERYFSNEKYFPYQLFPWEKFVFALHNCVYRKDGLLRWPILFVMVGRGAGKNGYEAFEAFSWLTPVNGVREYHVDIFATAEDQAKTSFEDVWNVLDTHDAELGKYFSWNKEVIENRKTRSKLRFRTSSAKTKDGGRPGAIVFDEYHAYENYKLISTAKTGLGKKRFPRQTIITTDGDVRGGPLDDMKTTAAQILNGDVGDNGVLPFICRLDDPAEVDKPELWYKANPSLQYFPTLRQELELEYSAYQRDPMSNSDFIVKRMDLPKTFDAQSVTDWGNILAAKKKLPKLDGCSCVAGIDYMKTNDFLSAGLLFRYKGLFCWMQHTWVCRASIDLPRIHAPLDDWEQAGYLTFMPGPEIPPNVPAEWLQKQAQKYQVTSLSIDNFRFTWLVRALREAGFDTDKGGANNIRLTKRVTQNRFVPVIASLFNTHKIIWGDDPMMGWYTNNTCVLEDRGNQYYGKKDARSRKTDGFMALVSAICASTDLPDCGEESSLAGLQVFAM